MQRTQRTKRLGTSWTGWLGAAAISLTSVVGYADSAAGVAAPQPTVQVLNAPGDVPANGGLLLQVNAPGAPIVMVTVTSGTAAISGHLVQLADTYWSWVPDAPLTPGQMYTVTTNTNAPGGFAQTTMFTTTAAWLPVKPQLSGSASVEVSTQNNQACCTTLPAASPTFASCFPIETQSFATLVPHLQDAAPLAEERQFLYRVVTPSAGDAGAVPQGQWVPSLGQLFGLPVTFDQQPDKFCIQVEAMEITQKTLYEFPELMLCASKSALPPLGTMMLTLDPAMLDHTRCQIPPSAYQAEFCKQNEAACGAHPTDPGCEGFGHTCQGLPWPPGYVDTDGGAPYIPGVDAGRDASVPADSGLDGGVQPVPQPVVHTDTSARHGGCAIAGNVGARSSAQHGPNLWLVLGGLALFFGVRRRPLQARHARRSGALRQR